MGVGGIMFEPTQHLQALLLHQSQVTVHYQRHPLCMHAQLPTPLRSAAKGSLVKVKSST